MKHLNEIKVTDNNVKFLLLEKIKTILDDKKEEETFSTSNNLFDDNIKITVYPSGVERSYEDRSVYINISKNKNDISFFLNGEEAIKVGQLLIKNGLLSLEDNMYNHQKIHAYNNLKEFIDQNIIDKVYVTLLNPAPVNYGDGFYMFNIKPKWKKGKEPEYQEDFNFNDVIYFSPFEDEFNQQLERLGGKDKVEFINYDREKEVEEFNNKVKQMENENNLSTMNEELLTYYDVKYANSSKIFEAEEIQDKTPDQIQAGEKLYNEILEKLNDDSNIDEGFWGSVLGAGAGALAGPAVGRAMCKALGIDEKGHLGKLLTSRLVTAAIGAALGK